MLVLQYLAAPRHFEKASKRPLIRWKPNQSGSQVQQVVSTKGIPGRRQALRSVAGEDSLPLLRLAAGLHCKPGP